MSKQDETQIGDNGSQPNTDPLRRPISSTDILTNKTLQEYLTTAEKNLNLIADQFLKTGTITEPNIQTINNQVNNFCTIIQLIISFSNDDTFKANVAFTAMLSVKSQLPEFLIKFLDYLQQEYVIDSATTAPLQQATFYKALKHIDLSNLIKLQQILQELAKNPVSIKTNSRGPVLLSNKLSSSQNSNQPTKALQTKLELIATEIEQKQSQKPTSTPTTPPPLSSSKN